MAAYEMVWFGFNELWNDFIAYPGNNLWAARVERASFQLSIRIWHHTADDVKALVSVFMSNSVIKLRD
jgi:hypothetical protein